MEEINEIKIPKGVERMSVKQHEDKIVFEFIPKEPKFRRGDILISTVEPDITVIFDKMTSITAFDSIYHNVGGSNHDWCLDRFRHATKEEKQEFFDELKADGKRWNAEKLKIEDILKNGDLAIFWDNDDNESASIRMYDRKDYSGYYDSCGFPWDNAIKFESKEQFEKILRGKI